MYPKLGVKNTNKNNYLINLVLWFTWFTFVVMEIGIMDIIEHFEYTSAYGKVIEPQQWKALEQALVETLKQQRELCLKNIMGTDFYLQHKNDFPKSYILTAPSPIVK